MLLRRLLVLAGILLTGVAAVYGSTRLVGKSPSEPVPVIDVSPRSTVEAERPEPRGRPDDEGDDRDRPRARPSPAGGSSFAPAGPPPAAVSPPSSGDDSDDATRADRSATTGRFGDDHAGAPGPAPAAPADQDGDGGSDDDDGEAKATVEHRRSVPAGAAGQCPRAHPRRLPRPAGLLDRRLDPGPAPDPAGPGRRSRRALAGSGGRRVPAAGERQQPGDRRAVRRRRRGDLRRVPVAQHPRRGRGDLHLRRRAPVQDDRQRCRQPAERGGCPAGHGHQNAPRQRLHAARRPALPRRPGQGQRPAARRLPDQRRARHGARRGHRGGGSRHRRLAGRAAAGLLAGLRHRRPRPVAAARPGGDRPCDHRERPQPADRGGGTRRDHRPGPDLQRDARPPRGRLRQPERLHLRRRPRAAYADHHHPRAPRAARRRSRGAARDDRAGLRRAARPGPTRRTDVVLDMVFDDEDALRRHLEARLDADVIRVDVAEIDFVRETTRVVARYRPASRQTPTDGGVHASVPGADR